MRKISRRSAIAKGLKQYFTGKPCPKGHITKRVVSNTDCCQCMAERAKIWHAKNKRYANQRARAWYHANLEYAKKYGRDYYWGLL